MRMEDDIMTKRFKYYSTSQMIVDDLTGFTYQGNQKICTLLNQLNEKSDMNAEAYYDLKMRFDEYMKVLRKYHIDDPKKLNQVLFWREL